MNSFSGDSMDQKFCMNGLSPACSAQRPRLLFYRYFKQSTRCSSSTWNFNVSDSPAAAWWFLSFLIDSSRLGAKMYILYYNIKFIILSINFSAFRNGIWAKASNILNIHRPHDDSDYLHSVEEFGKHFLQRLYWDNCLVLFQIYLAKAVPSLRQEVH